MRLRAIKQVFQTYKELMAHMLGEWGNHPFLEAIDRGLQARTVEEAEQHLETLIALLNEKQSGAGDKLAQTVINVEARMMNT